MSKFWSAQWPTELAENGRRGWRERNVPHGTFVAFMLRILHRFTLLPTAASGLPPRLARAHALKNCIDTLCAINRVLASEIPERALPRVSRSLHAAQRMMLLIEEDFLADDVNRRVSEPAFAPATSIMQEIHLRVADLAESRGVHLLLLPGPGGLHGDRCEIAQGLGNVVVNAIDASKQGGAVTVESCESADGGQLWTVRDSGSGMPKDELGRSGTPCRARCERGGGLGLAVARDIFERHGGLAQIESALGLGTIVRIWLPTAPPPPPARTTW